LNSKEIEIGGGFIFRCVCT